MQCFYREKQTTLGPFIRGNIPNNGSGRSQACRNCGWSPHSRDQCPVKNVTRHYCHKVGDLAKVCLSKLKKKDLHDIEATSNGCKRVRARPKCPHVSGPNQCNTLDISSVHAISSKEKALLEVSLAPSPEGKQTRVLSKIDSSSGFNIIPTSLYNQLGPRVRNLQKPTMKLTAYGGTEILNLVSCQVYVKVPNNPKPEVIQAEVVDVDGPLIIGNISAQSLNLLKLNQAVAIESNSKSTSPLNYLMHVVNHILSH